MSKSGSITFNKLRQSDGWRRLGARVPACDELDVKANPDGGWPPAEGDRSQPHSSAPTSLEIEDVVRQVAEIPRPERDQAGRLLVAGVGLGAALNGVEMSAAENRRSP